MKILDHPLALPIAAGAAIFSNAFALGYALGKRRAERETLAVFEPFAEEPEEESPQLELDFSQLGTSKPNHPSNQDGEFTPLEPALLKTLPRAKELKPIFERTLEEIKPKPHKDTVIRHNAFATPNDGWDYEVELANRDDDRPYIIHVDEFVSNEEEFDQITITYFEGDNIMVDDKDVPIYGHERLVGDLKFGHGSGDPNVVYIRNTSHSVEYEIMRHTGSYSVEILHLSPEDSGV